MSYWKERDVECLSLECSGVKELAQTLQEKPRHGIFCRNYIFGLLRKLGIEDRMEVLKIYGDIVCIVPIVPTYLYFTVLLSIYCLHVSKTMGTKGHICEGGSVPEKNISGNDTIISPKRGGLGDLMVFSTGA